MKEIFYELIEEALTGIIMIDGDPWPIGFNTVIYDNENICSEKINNDNLTTLVIKNKDEFFKVFEEYINLKLEKDKTSTIFVNDKERNKIKLLMAYLFANATTEDFLNPVIFIKRNISFLKDDTFSYLNKGMDLELGDIFKCCLELKNETCSLFMETPNKIDISLIKEEDNQKLVYNLPSIYYGINLNGNHKECYIYSILNKKEEVKEEKFIKEISRKLYKINKGVREDESDEYMDYKEGKSDYYPENISDVSPSAVLSLVVFLTLLKKENVNKVMGVSYLPIRYLSRDFTAKNQKDETKKMNMIERNAVIQKNITEKFIRTIRRAAYHMEGVEIISYPYEVDEFITLDVANDKFNTNNQLLNEVTSSISK